LLPGSILAILNIFVVACHYLNHIFGYGWGFLVFSAVLAVALLMPGQRYYTTLIAQGMSSEKAAKRSNMVVGPCFMLFLIIAVYVFFHGGNVSYPV
jgi:hypothetical protein